MSSAGLAHFVILAHLAFIVFVVMGGVMVRWFPWAAIAHLPAFAWAAYVMFTGTICPLTPLEIALRQSAGQPGYAGGFVEHYIVPVIYPPGLTRSIQIGIGVAVVVLNAAVYAWALYVRRDRPTRMSATNRT